MKRHYELDGLRGLWALLIVMVHAGVPCTQQGYIFMDGFFSLSAFVIAGSLKDDDARSARRRLREFFTRRAARILPGYYVTVLSGIGLAWLANFVVASVGRTWRPYSLANAWHFMLFLQFTPLYWFPTGIYRTPQLLNHLWSLAVEEQFYVLIGTAWIVVGRREFRLWIALGCVCAGIWARVSASSPLLLPYHLDAFGYGLLGLLAYRRLHEQPALGASLRRIAGLASVAAFAVFTWHVLSHRADEASVPTGSWTPANLLSSLGCGGLVLWLATARGAPWLGWLRQPVTLYLGRISYALYLCHHLIASLGTFSGGFTPGSVVSQVEIVALSLCCADLLNRKLERWRARINGSGISAPTR